jgi:hypothetical protein
VGDTGIDHLPHARGVTPDIPLLTCWPRLADTPTVTAMLSRSAASTSVSSLHPFVPLHATVFSALRAGEAEHTDPALDPEFGRIEDSAGERELEVHGTEAAAERGGGGVQGCRCSAGAVQVQGAGRGARCAGVGVKGGAKVMSESVERRATGVRGAGAVQVRGAVRGART